MGVGRSSAVRTTPPTQRVPIKAVVTADVSTSLATLSLKQVVGTTTGSSGQRSVTLLLYSSLFSQSAELNIPPLYTVEGFEVKPLYTVEGFQVKPIFEH